MLAQNSAAILDVTPPAMPVPGGDFPRTLKKSATRVLVVDDEQLVRWSIAETLRSRGFEVVEANDGRTALDLIDKTDRPPAAVFLDLKLPDYDDLTLLAAVRRHLPRVPVILMTAFGTPEIVLDARRLGAFTVLEKPFDLDELDGLLARAFVVPQPH